MTVEGRRGQMADQAGHDDKVAGHDGEVAGHDGEVAGLDEKTGI